MPDGRWRRVSRAEEATALPPRALIVTMYGLYARESDGWLSVAALVKLMAQLGVDEPAVRSAISRLKRRSVITPERVDGSAGYTIGEHTRRMLELGDRRIFDAQAGGVVRRLVAGGVQRPRGRARQASSAPLAVGLAGFRHRQLGHLDRATTSRGRGPRGARRRGFRPVRGVVPRRPPRLRRGHRQDCRLVGPGRTRRPLLGVRAHQLTPSLRGGVGGARSRTPKRSATTSAH